MHINHLFLVAALVFGSSIPASAQTRIRIVGSNGDRGPTQTAISKILTNWTFQGTEGSTTSAGSLTPARDSNFGAWNGQFNSQPVIIKVSFSGALAGIAAVAGNTDQRFVATDAPAGRSGGVPNPLTATNTSDYETGKADFGFSTNFQNTSPFLGVLEGVTYNPVIEERVGISPLGFYASPGFPGSNITTQLAQLLYTSGAVRLALFTGDYANDFNKIVYAIGRNTDAGQRFGAYTEIGLGTSRAVRVWSPAITGQQTSVVPPSASVQKYGGTVDSHLLWPAETVNSIFSPLGSGGFNSGANLAPVLTTVLGPNAYKGRFVDEFGDEQFTFPSATAGYYVGYLTPGDAANRVFGADGSIPPANRGVALSYNGVPLTTPNVQSGRYTAWLYNRLLRPQGDIPAGLVRTLADTLRDQIKNTDAIVGGGIKDDATFRVKRSQDGGLVTPK